MNAYPFGSFGPEHLKKIKPGIDCFNAQEYWECHEELEHVWLEDRNDPARLIYWAIIQVAASLYHVEQENIIGARGLLKKSKDKFNRADQGKVVTDIVEKYLSWSKLKSLVFALDEEKVELSDFELLHNFRFNQYREVIE
jgi:hypothetical protein